MQDTEVDITNAPTDPLDLIEMMSWQELNRYSIAYKLSNDDFTFNAALWGYFSFCNIYQGYLDSPMGQLLGI
jgi:hypothetical protein